ncbi:transient receptor potential cation channel subfamily V member 4-like [Gigaspora margarita]|uniref:Transient receptor potential cation channel subfamily V member 4-like n=1 Tax=Gigaspora margarita TaxID=4874 RepID=A0A8H4EVY3_GIGMA|nr:transient receptor potential cation channel subfamily V member 4-like [Gigaspora margarita]
MSTREQSDHMEIKVEESGGHEHKGPIYPHRYEITNLICSPNLKYIATLSEKDESILIWPVLGNEPYLKASTNLKITELDTQEDIERVYKLEELSDDALIVLISETSCIMYDTNKEQHVAIPHFNEQVLQTSEIHVSFFKNGYFVFISESKLYLYSVITKDPNTWLQCKNIFGFTIELKHCSLSRDGRLLIGKEFFKFQWDINSEKFEMQYPVADDFIFNKYENLLAVWHNRDLTLNIYSKKGIKILSHKIKIDNYKKQDNEYFQINFLNLGERLLISHFTNAKMQNYLIDPYQEYSKDSKKNTNIKLQNYLIDPYQEDSKDLKKNTNIELDLYNELNSKYVGFIPKKIFENKIIGIVNRKVQVHDLFQKDFQVYLQEETNDKNKIHFLCIMKEILKNIEEAESYISGPIKDDTELIYQIKQEHMELVIWEYGKNSDGKMELTAHRKGDHPAKLNVMDIFVEKDSPESLIILAFKSLTNGELMIITKWHHLLIREFTIVVALDNDEIQIKYFFNTSYLRDLLNDYKDFLKKCKMDSEMGSEIDKDLLKCKVVSEKLFSVDYFKFIFKNFDFGIFDPNNTLSKLIEGHINDNSFFALYAQNLLAAAISERRIDLVDQVFVKCMEIIYDDPAKIDVLKIISSLSLELHEIYPDYFNRFISQTSLLLHPSHFLRRAHIFYTSDSHLQPHAIEPFMFKLSLPARIYLLISNFISRLIFFYKKFYRGLSKIKLVDKQSTIPAIHLVVPLPGFSTYDTDYSFWKEMLGRPKSNGFVEIQTPELYSSWGGEVLLNFKWNMFGKYYYYFDWAIYTFFLMTFSLAVTETGRVSESVKELLLWTSIILGLFLLIYIELRQFIFNWRQYIFNLWNCFDFGSLVSPVVISIYWLLNGPPPLWAPSLSCLFLDIKFLFYLRAFEYFGVYFAIITGVAQTAFSYLIVLGMIILAFAHALYILLQETSKNIGSNDVNTDLYTSFDTSLLAVYLLMTGDNSSLSTWDYHTNRVLVLLMVAFSFFTVIYLLNLFIGLLSNAIEEYDNRAEFLIQKAEVTRNFF